MFVYVAVEGGTGAGLMLALSCLKNYIPSIHCIYNIINIFLAGATDSPHS